MDNSRTKNAKMNVIFGYIAQIGILLLSFAGRKIFLHFLSADYLGINGLFSNILTILSLAELGLDTAVVFTLYKPVAENNKTLIYSMMRYFKKLYFGIAIGILLVGLLIVPLLQFIVNSDLPYSSLTIYYVLFLVNTVASYFVAYKVALLSAYQENRIYRIISLVSNLLLQILHIVVLLIWKNYYIYIIATVLNTLISNFMITIICNKRHKDIFSQYEVIQFDKKPIKDRVFKVFLYKIGTVLINSTDNILISILVSTLAVGLYSNYYTVVSAINGFVLIISSALVSGIGNYAAQGKKEEQGSLFDAILLLFHGIAALGLIGFSLLFNNLITLWLGKEYLYDDLIVFMISFNFYIATAIAPVWMFREANGLFDKVKYLILIRALINIVLSVIFGIFWGVFGIFLATAISLFLTSFWREPNIISKEVFKRSPVYYWKKQVYYLLNTCIAFALSYFFTRNLGNSFLFLVVKALIITLTTSLVFIIFNFKSIEFKKLKSYIFKRK